MNFPCVSGDSLAPDNLRSVLGRLGLSQTGAARLLGVNARTVRGWCEPPGAPGHRSMPATVWRMLDLIEHVPGVRDRLETTLARL